jgi:hypothetical protein
MKYLTILCLILSGCTSNTIKSDTCYVKWSKQEYKDKYLAGLGKTREEKSDKHLLFPMWENGGIYVTENGARFDISDENGSKLLDKIIKENFTLPDYRREDVYRSLMAVEIKIGKTELSKMVKEYEQVDCEQYQESTYL